MVKLSTICGFTEGVSVDVLYLEINDVLEYNLPSVQSDFTLQSRSDDIFMWKNRNWTELQIGAQKYDKAKFISSQCEKYNLW